MKEILLSGPGKNALGSALMRQVIASLVEANGEPTLITGAQDAFSAGLDLKELLSLDAAGMKDFLALLEAMTRALWEYPGPTVALVNGHAIAGGCVLVLCCDHRVMIRNDKARIGLNEVALGLRFPPRVLEVVSKRLPRRHWERVILGADLFDGPLALALGLVDELDEQAGRLARERLALLSRHPPDAYARTKQLLRGLGSKLSADETARFDREDLPLWTSAGARERIRAMLRR